MADGNPARKRIEKLQAKVKQLTKANKKLREDRDFLLEKFNEKRDEREEMIKELQSLRTAREEHQRALTHKEQTIQMMRHEVTRSRHEAESYINSTSWKVTAPIRAVINKIKRS